MVFAANIAVKRGLMRREDADRLEHLLQELRLPTKVPLQASDPILETMRRDKKVKAGKIYFVLPKGIGYNPVLEPVSEKEIMGAMERLMVEEG